ncbi:hypothetical protein HA402_009492, partial [Bradysia odoriphaga]
PVTTIHGSPDLYIDTGSTVNLTCIVRHLPEPPATIQWTHNNEEINYDSPRGGVSVITEKGEITTSYLLIQRAKISDSGKYTCTPSHANPQTVNVHVLNGEEPAAIQRGNNLHTKSPIFILIVVLISLIFQRQIKCRRRERGDFTNYEILKAKLRSNKFRLNSMEFTAVYCGIFMSFNKENVPKLRYQYKH